MVKTQSNLISSYFSPKKQAQSKAIVNKKQKLQQQKDFTSSKTQKPVTKKITKRPVKNYKKKENPQDPKKPCSKQTNFKQKQKQLENKILKSFEIQKAIELLLQYDQNEKKYKYDIEEIKRQIMQLDKQQKNQFLNNFSEEALKKINNQLLSQVVYGVAEIIGILIRHNDDQESLKEFAKLCVKILENLYKLREQENRLLFTELGEIFEQYLADCIYQNKAFKQELIQQNVLEVAIKLRWNLPLLYQLISMLDKQMLLVLDIQNKTGYELKIDGIDSIQKLELLLGNCLNDYNPKLYRQKLGSEIKNCIAYNENLLNIEPQEKNQSIQSYDNMSHQEESTLDSEKQKSFKSVSSFNSEKSEEIKSDQLSSFQFLENFYKQTLEQKIPKQLITDSFWNLYNWTAIDSKGRIIDPDNFKKKVQIPWGSHILFSEDIPSDILECSFLQNQRVVVLGRQSLKSQIGVKINSDSLMYKVKGMVQIKKQLSTKQYNEIISKLAQVSQEKKQQIQNDNIRSKHLFPQQF